jgi:hypothetical protein
VGGTAVGVGVGFDKPRDPMLQAEIKKTTIRKNDIRFIFPPLSTGWVINDDYCGES